jgi:hypothetical protein
VYGGVGKIGQLLALQWLDYFLQVPEACLFAGVN